MYVICKLCRYLMYTHIYTYIYITYYIKKEQLYYYSYSYFSLIPNIILAIFQFTVLYSIQQKIYICFISIIYNININKTFMCLITIGIDNRVVSCSLSMTLRKLCKFTWKQCLDKPLLWCRGDFFCCPMSYLLSLFKITTVHKTLDSETNLHYFLDLRATIGKLLLN